ncbi:MAG: ParB/RepB/Spo0J family partition protein [Chloroflexi bacterium]|nr:ParB/RepB/Spo0J family partition protein [Chloroflexota bacterium]
MVRNPENPRLIFRESDMNLLLESIQEVGIQVPLTVYWDPDKRTYVILDGERRWRCALKLNLLDVPAIVQAKPSRLENILMMFNIHNVRVAWDPLPMALKLRAVKELLEAEGKPAEIKELAAVTGLKPVTVRRAFELLGLPDRYQRMLLEEAEKPRNEQEITADLFVEIYKSWNAIKRHTPEILDVVNDEGYVDSMVSKYRGKVIDNVVHFRNVSKIARAELAGASKHQAISILKTLINDPNYSVKQAFDDSVRNAYEERDLLTRIRTLREKLDELQPQSVTPDIREELTTLLEAIARLTRKA